ncbi:stage V sporulation protein SpoVM [Pasteuria penetrans]
MRFYTFKVPRLIGGLIRALLSSRRKKH